MPSEWSDAAALGDVPDSTSFRTTGFDARSVIRLSLLPFAHARAGLAPFAPMKERNGYRDQSFDSPCCHLRRCSPNHETMIAASRNGIIALEIAAPSPSCPAIIAR